MNSTSHDLFGEPEPSGALAPTKPGLPASITATSTGMPPEWGPYALDIVFSNRKAYPKSLTAASTSELVRAMWVFALARHESLMAKRSAAASVAFLSGHCLRDDMLNQALCIIDAHAVEGREIPPAREFGPQFDLRHLAGPSPFPIRDSAAA
jgi:hypothetical protein